MVDGPGTTFQPGAPRPEDIGPNAGRVAHAGPQTRIVQQHQLESNSPYTVAADRVRLEVADTAFVEPVNVDLIIHPSTVATGPGNPAPAVRAPRSSTRPDISPPPGAPFRLTLPYSFRITARSIATGTEVQPANGGITLTVSYGAINPADFGMGRPRVFVYDEPSQQWVRLRDTLNEANQTLIVELPHLSDFSIGTDGGLQPDAPPKLDSVGVDACTGYVRREIPLTVPPGIAGLTPEVVLRYDSGLIDEMREQWVKDGGNYDNTWYGYQAGWAGLGWTLTFGSITESSPVGAPRQASLIWQGRSQSLTSVDGRGYDPYGNPPHDATVFKTINDEFLRIRRFYGGRNLATDNGYWVIETKDGTRYRFGYNVDSATVTENGFYGRGGDWNRDWRQVAIRYDLDQIQDRNGNTVDITYDSKVEWSAGAPYALTNYPLEINYGGNPSKGLPHTRRIRFNYGPRLDCPQLPPHDFYTQKLDSIDVYLNYPNKVRSYTFSYGYGNIYWDQKETSSSAPPQLPQVAGFGKLLLQSVEEFDGSGAPKTPAPAYTFTYWQGAITPGVVFWNMQLQTVTSAYGGTLSYNYEVHHPDHWWVGSGGPTSHMGRRYRVTQVQLNPAMNNSNFIVTTRYIYQSPAYMWWKQLFSGQWIVAYRGHALVDVVDALGNVERSAFYTRDDLTFTTVAGQIVTRLADAINYINGRCYYKEVRPAGGTTWLTRDEYIWNLTRTQAANPGYERDAHFVSQGSAWHFENGPSGIVGRSTFLWYDEYGNVNLQRESQDAFAGDRAGGTGWTRQKSFVFFPNNALSDASSVQYGTYIVNKPCRESLLEASSGLTLSETRYNYDGNLSSLVAPGASGTPGLLTAVRRSLLNGQCADTSSTYDQFGNKLTSTEYGTYGTIDGAFGSDPRTTTATYDPIYFTYIRTVTNPLNQAETRSYDARWGRLTQRIDANAAVTDNGYDTFGRLTSVLGPSANGVRKYTSYSYPAPAVDAQGRTTATVTTIVRADNSSVWLPIACTTYDGLGRPIQTTVQADASGTAVIVNSFFDSRGLLARTSVPHHAGGAAGVGWVGVDWVTASNDTQSTYDALKRPTSVQQPDGTSARTTYDGWSKTVTDQNNHRKQYDADGVGRMVKIHEYAASFGEAITTYGYDARDLLVDVLDAASNRTRLTYDVLGRKTQMQDPDMGTWSYTYDPVGTLNSQTDALNQTTSFVYDALKRPIRTYWPLTWTSPTPAGPSVYDIIELRCAIDTDRVAAGQAPFTWTDAAIVAGTGVLVRAVHFNELRTAISGMWPGVPQFTRGPIVASSRVISAQDLADLRAWLVQYEAGSSTRARVVQQYDQAPSGIGHRTGMWDGSGRGSWLYDPAGRLAQEMRTIDGRLHTSTNSYDALDRLTRLELPDGEQLNYTYGVNGLLATLASSLGTTLVSSVTYTAHNQPRRWLLGSSSWVSQTYYGLDGIPLPAGGTPFGALQTSQWPEGVGALVNRTLRYDGVGNVTQLTDSVNAESISYGYDELDRLTGASGGIAESIQYNAIGNLTVRNGVALGYPASGGPPGTHPHAVTNYSGASYGYDANGSMITHAGRTIAYDPLRRPVRLDQGATVWRASYDGDGIRRKRLDAYGTIHYVGNGYENNLGNGQNVSPVVTKYYTAFGRVIAFRKNNTLYWVGTDHLGGTIRVTDATFNSLDQMRYLPFGGARNTGTNLSTDHLFTGQIQDRSTGLYWYSTRALDVNVGRFCCPDTVVPSAGDPQSLNRYSYVCNNPIRCIDPTGHYHVNVRDFDPDSQTTEDGAARIDDQDNQVTIRPAPLGMTSAIYIGETSMGQRDDTKRLYTSVAPMVLDTLALTADAAGDVALGFAVLVSLVPIAGPGVAAVAISADVTAHTLAFGAKVTSFGITALADLESGHSGIERQDHSLTIWVGGDTVKSFETLNITGLGKAALSLAKPFPDAPSPSSGGVPDLGKYPIFGLGGDIQRVIDDFSRFSQPEGPGKIVVIQVPLLGR